MDGRCIDSSSLLKSSFYLIGIDIAVTRKSDEVTDDEDGRPTDLNDLAVKDDFTLPS